MKKEKTRFAIVSEVEESINKRRNHPEKDDSSLAYAAPRHAARAVELLDVCAPPWSDAGRCPTLSKLAFILPWAELLQARGGIQCPATCLR